MVLVGWSLLGCPYIYIYVYIYICIYMYTLFSYIHTFILFGGFNHAVSSPPKRERERLSQPTFQKYMIWWCIVIIYRYGIPWHVMYVVAAAARWRCRFCREHLLLQGAKATWLPLAPSCQPEWLQWFATCIEITNTIYLFIYRSIHLSIYLSISVCIYTYIHHVYIYIYICICMYVCTQL